MILALGKEGRPLRKSTSQVQIAFALRQAEGGTPVPEVCRKMGISESAFYQWKCEGIGVTEIRRLRATRRREPQAEAAGRRPLPGQGDVAKDVIQKTLKPARKREVVGYLCRSYRVSERKACLRSVSHAQATITIAALQSRLS
jgi:hypothetical protein